MNNQTENSNTPARKDRVLSCRQAQHFVPVSGLAGVFEHSLKGFFMKGKVHIISKTSRFSSAKVAHHEKVDSISVRYPITPRMFCGFVWDEIKTLVRRNWDIGIVWLIAMSLFAWRVS